MSYRNAVVNGPKKKGGKKRSSKGGKKKAAKKPRARKAAKPRKKRASKKAPRRAGKKRSAKRSGKKRGGKKRAKKAAASKPIAPPIPRRPAAARPPIAPPIGGARRPAPRPPIAPPIGAAPAKRRAAKKGASKIKVDAATFAKLTRGLSPADVSALEAARRAGTGEKALGKLARAARRAARKSGKAPARKASKRPARKAPARKASKRPARKASSAGGSRRGFVPGDQPIRAGAVPARRQAARKGRCRPSGKPPVRCQPRPSASSAAACSTANARWNKQRREDGLPTKSTKRACGPGVPGKRPSARLLGHRKASKVGPKTQGTRKVKRVTEQEQRRIMSAFLRS